MGEAAKLFTRSLMMGLDSAVRKPEFAEPTAEDIENMPYHEAVELLKKRDVIKKVDYDKLSDKMKFRAFTASRINDGKLLERLNAEMLSNVDGGKGLKDFLSLTKTDILDKIGMGPNQGWYWETVYRTNVQTAYNVGRAMGFEADKPLALQFVGIDDARQTDVCYSLSGIVRPYGDPFWQSHFPPLHFNCRSTIRAIYDEAELPKEWSTIDEAESPAKGFGSYPLDSDNWWKELDSQVRQAKQFGVQGEIEAAKEMLIKYKSKNVEIKDIVPQEVSKPNNFDNFNEVKSKWEVKYSVKIAPEIEDMDKNAIISLLDEIEKIIAKEPFLAPKIIRLEETGIMSRYYGKELVINPKYFSNNERMNLVISELAKQRKIPVNSVFKNIVEHEFKGHGLEEYLIDLSPEYLNFNQRQIAWDECKEARKIVNEAIHNVSAKEPNKSKFELLSEICEYATKYTDSEIMAYGIQDVLTNGDAAASLSKEILTISKKQLKIYTRSDK